MSRPQVVFKFERHKQSRTWMKSMNELENEAWSITTFVTYVIVVCNIFQYVFNTKSRCHGVLSQGLTKGSCVLCYIIIQHICWMHYPAIKWPSTANIPTQHKIIWACRRCSQNQINPWKQANIHIFDQQDWLFTKLYQTKGKSSPQWIALL